MKDNIARTLVERMFAVEMAFMGSKHRDVGQLADAFAEDVVVREPHSLPYGGNWIGLDGISALITRMSDVWSDMRIDDLEVTGSPERVYLSCELTMVSRVSGKTTIQPFCERLDFRDGRLVEGIPFYHDTQALIDLIAPG
ncbi:nuclear transport factor 2 family protein [Neorhizobium alkalisoli]|uniref:nuclear transport factor 2 family protein n=1 Tax=Neorhizobium alkalisoli TaxID=528178 RepID=UPI000CF9DBF9|nr:nuclear transport factor 2 family protein [Neorhizobium alkalisoli]